MRRQLVAIRSIQIFVTQWAQSSALQTGTHTNASNSINGCYQPFLRPRLRRGHFWNKEKKHIRGIRHYINTSQDWRVTRIVPIVWQFWLCENLSMNIMNIILGLSLYINISAWPFKTATWTQPLSVELDWRFNEGHTLIEAGKRQERCYETRCHNPCNTLCFLQWMLHSICTEGVGSYKKMKF